MKELFGIDWTQVRDYPKSFDMGFGLSLEDGYQKKSVKNVVDPGNSEITIKEKGLINDIAFMDTIMDYRESVHGNMTPRETVSMDSLKSLGRISMPPVNHISQSTNTGSQNGHI